MDIFATIVLANSDQTKSVYQNSILSVKNSGNNLNLIPLLAMQLITVGITKKKSD